jgi:hypothetical protein
MLHLSHYMVEGPVLHWYRCFLRYPKKRQWEAGFYQKFRTLFVRSFLRPGDLEVVPLATTARPL